MTLSLYLHIPFCEVKCGYCDFFSVPRGHEDFDLQKAYVRELIREIAGRTAALLPTQIDTIFFGGGTPSLLEPRLMESIFKELSRHFSWDHRAEITMEANPKTVSLDRLKAFRALGINRLSVGIQSFQDKYLRVLGRIHSGKEAQRTIRDAFEAGFENINLDLIYALPGQTLSEFESDLETAICLKTPHLSAYNLTIESGTPFEQLYKAGTLKLPAEDDQIRMFDLLRSTRSVSPYEISNFSRPGYECRHNLNYWNYGEWLGFGAGAVSFQYPRRRQNVRNLKRYLEGAWEAETEEVPLQTAMGEFMMMGLRKSEGISVDLFQNKFGRPLRDVYGKIVDRLCDGNFLNRRGAFLNLTEKGLPLANEVVQKFFP